jgi:hypothetical protein
VISMEFMFEEAESFDKSNFLLYKEESFKKFNIDFNVCNLLN